MLELEVQIERGDPLGVQETLANARVARDLGEDAAREHLQQVLPRILTSKDAMEGVQSFLERREARFTGE